MHFPRNCTRLRPEVQQRRVGQQTLRARWRAIKEEEILEEGRRSKRNPITPWLDGEGCPARLIPLATDVCSRSSGLDTATLSNDSLLILNLL